MGTSGSMRARSPANPDVKVLQKELYGASQTPYSNLIDNFPLICPDSGRGFFIKASCVAVGCARLVLPQLQSYGDF